MNNIVSSAPSMCSGHPTGMWDSSKSPSPFCSMIVPEHWDINFCLEANLCSLAFPGIWCEQATWPVMPVLGIPVGPSSGSTSSLITSLRPCSGWGCPWSVCVKNVNPSTPSRVPKSTLSLSHYARRKHLLWLRALQLLTFSAMSK